MKVLVTFTLFLLLTLSTVHAQEEPDCTIDLSSAIGLLADAQVDAAEDTEAALRKIERAREALEAIEEACDPGQNQSDITIQINGVYEDPDELFTFNYPSNWRVGEFTPAEDDSGGGVILGNQDADMPTESEPLAEGEQLLMVGVGSASFLGIGGLAEEEIPLEERLVGRLTTLNDATVEADNIATFDLNEYAAAEATIITNGIAQYFVIIEVEYENRYIAVAAIGMAGDLKALQLLVRAVAQTVQINEETENG
jgi:hypothetical protein